MTATIEKPRIGVDPLLEDIVLEQLTEQTIELMHEVLKKTGPGKKVETYQKALELELKKQRINYGYNEEFTLNYSNSSLGVHYQHLLIDHKLVLELKTTEKLEEKHCSQVISKLKNSHFQAGLVINFSERFLEVWRVKL